MKLLLMNIGIKRSKVLIGVLIVQVIGLVSGIILVQKPQHFRKKALEACPTTSDINYSLIPVAGSPADHPDYLHGDLNLSLRNYETADNATLGLIRYDGDTDPDAIQLSRIFADNRVPVFTTAYEVYGWNWDSVSCGGNQHGCRGLILSTPWQANVAVIDMQTLPSERIYVPSRRGNIHSGEYKALVVYAEEQRITLVYRREDTVANGYAVHFENICIDPNLLALYRSRIDGQGNRITTGGLQLPGLRDNQSLGTALGETVGVAVRDRGSFMDPRSMKDWWQSPNTISTPTPVPTSIPSPSPISASWRGDYFNNKDLSGPLAVTRNDTQINFNWDYGTPHTLINSDVFSVRWTKSQSFVEGSYVFKVNTDDGMRVFVNGQSIIDVWYDQSPHQHQSNPIYLTSGNHNIMVEYYENSGGATASLWWELVSGPSPSPSPSPTPTTIPTPTPSPPTTYPDWKGEYFNNKDLSGSPVVTRNDTDINFDWDYSTSTSGVGSDNFSARWTKSQYFQAGNYTFHVTTDDGMKVWIDNDLKLDKWFLQAPTDYTFSTYLSEGYHNIKVEYYENTGLAVAKVGWEVGSTPSPSPSLAPTPTPNVFSNWRGDYYSNRNLLGSPVLTRNDPEINFIWDSNSPHALLPQDQFSVRWSSDGHFDEGIYVFKITTDDGMRVLVNGQSIIDVWHDQSPSQHQSNSIYLSSGNHNIMVEYYENIGGATARLWWEKLSTPGPTSTPSPSVNWRGEYFNNKDLSGTPALTRDDSSINFNWDYGVPHTSINRDVFSVRWTKSQSFQAGNYTFHVTTDDGMKVWIDNDLKLDKWFLQAPTDYTFSTYLSEGSHDLKVEYYENIGLAVAKIWWERQ